jgi:hypothetical protein
MNRREAALLEFPIGIMSNRIERGDNSPQIRPTGTGQYYFHTYAVG